MNYVIAVLVTIAVYPLMYRIISWIMSKMGM